MKFITLSIGKNLFFIQFSILQELWAETAHKFNVQEESRKKCTVNDGRLGIFECSNLSFNSHRRWMSTRSPRRCAWRSSLHTRVDEFISHRNRRKRAPPLFSFLRDAEKNHKKHHHAEKKIRHNGKKWTQCRMQNRKVDAKNWWHRGTHICRTHLLSYTRRRHNDAHREQFTTFT